MTATYRWVQWNRHKKVYDLTLIGICIAYTAGFVSVSLASAEPPDEMVTLIRATGTLAFTLLHAILLVGPLARFSTRVSPFLYNRRHAGVLLFSVALAHAALVTVYYGAWGPLDPVRALFAYEPGIPFEFWGFVALAIMFLMASTSHDFWLANLGHRSWKTLHMLVYVAYSAVVLHVVAGALQDQSSPVLAALTLLGVAVVVGAHLAAGLKERTQDGRLPAPPEDSWLDVGPVADLPLNKARVIGVKGAERIALVRHERGVSAVSNVCKHQGGPLGEGEVIDGCLTCPWHGYQYRPEDGRSPPPYTERVPTYPVRVVRGNVQVHLNPNPPGTHVEPASARAQERDHA
ncbi:MAG: ferric reductase-like transmembrane domain-containing protein [Phycisphaerales bacterium JB040]